MIGVSLFSGVGGFELGLERAGVETVLQAEIDPSCREVLARTWPQIPCVEDVRDVTAALALRRGPVDLVYGGFPCQDVSNAYARGVYEGRIDDPGYPQARGGGGMAGLDGIRSGLFWQFHRVAAETKAPWLILENVTALLRSNAGRDWLVILRALDDLGYGLAWSVLDARGFGVAQQRRRLLLVGHLGDGAGAAQVLDLAARRQRHAGEGYARGRPYAGLSEEAARAAGPLSVAENQQAEFRVLPFCPALTTGGGKVGQGYQAFVWGDTFRRYTFEEQEALMGWPRGHTAGFPDGTRQRMLGNGVVAPVAGWLGGRLVAVASTYPRRELSA